MKTINYIPETEAMKRGHFLWKPTWFSYDTRPQRISPFLFTVLSLLPWYKTNPFNGYLVRMNKWTRDNDFSDFIYNPHEKTDSILREELGFNQ